MKDSPAWKGRYKRPLMFSTQCSAEHYAQRVYHLNAETNLPKVNVATVEAWEMVYEAKGGQRYRKDKPLLDQVAKMRANQTVLSNLGGDDALKDIIFKNKFAPCNTCSGGSSTYSLMHHYLIDVAYFAQNYANNRPGFDLVKGNQGMRNNGGHQVAATAFTIRTLHNAGIVGSITGFEIQIETINDAGETNTAFADILQEGDKIIECKSWALNGKAFQNFVAGTSGSVTQFKTYLSDQARVTSMNQLEYWFDGKKGVTESQVKEKFKQMMYNGTTLTTQGTAVFNAIWANTGLRGNLFPATVDMNQTTLDSNKESFKITFSTMISLTTNTFYNFIKAK